jgi:hypothetical protein
MYDHYPRCRARVEVVELSENVGRRVERLPGYLWEDPNGPDEAIAVRTRAVVTGRLLTPDEAFNVFDKSKAERTQDLPTFVFRVHHCKTALKRERVA